MESALLFHPISIHAPARGATITQDNPSIARYISIHAPARGATVLSLYFLFRIYLISIHAPARGATKTRYVMEKYGYISIHAPARGATKSFLICCRLFRLFQSTLPRGERLVQIPLLAYDKDFNPRSREGSDGLVGICTVVSSYFNPRSREGSDYNPR